MKKWTDKLVKQFAKVVTKCSYGKYKDCKTLQQKLKRFKQIHKIK